MAGVGAFVRRSGKQDAHAGPKQGVFVPAAVGVVPLSVAVSIEIGLASVELLVVVGIDVVA